MKSTIWDKIYRDYQSGGPAYATLQGKIEGWFEEFVAAKSFPKKSAFDIGYGTGTYLQLLKLKGFKVAGLDSSETAHKMATENLGGDADLLVAEMYSHSYPANAYGLVVSVRTLHHGRKSQITELIKAVHQALVPEGWAYLTLPLDTATNHWHSFKDKREVEPGTFVPQSGPEAGLPHSFFSKLEAEKLFADYSKIEIREYTGNWHIAARK